MKSQALDALATLMMSQYEKITGSFDQYEYQYLRESASKGYEEFVSACRSLFGQHYENALLGSAKEADREIAWNCENNSGRRWKTENEIMVLLESVDALKNAVILTGRILKSSNAQLCDDAEKIAKRVRRNARWYRERLDPTGKIAPETPDPIVTPNLRNYPLEKKIYVLRTQQLLTFAEIGKIVGLSASAVSRLFRRTYRDVHGFAAEIPKLVRRHGGRTLCVSSKDSLSPQLLTQRNTDE